MVVQPARLDNSLDLGRAGIWVMREISGICDGEPGCKDNLKMEIVHDTTYLGAFIF
jgi:hypothetical protein